MPESVAGQTRTGQQPSITPLPKLQLFLIIFIQIAEPVTSTVIYPFVNDLVRALGINHGDEKKTGYYVGLIESIFYAAEALTVIQWGRASDTMGRRPILLGGMLGLTFAMLSFGLSTQYWMLIASRCAQGVFNGNIGVTKSVMAEITDATNAPRAFSFLPVAWSIGSTLGPFLGGFFARPAERWPAVFGRVQFFKDFPYFLPCAVATTIPLLAFLFASLGLKETLPSAIERTHKTRSTKSETSPIIDPEVSRTYGTITAQHAQNKNTAPTPQPPPPPPPPPFRALLIPRVLIPITNFAFLAFLDQSMLVLLPLIYSTPLHLGGLGLPPSVIGTTLGVWGVINGFVQVLCFTSVRHFLGHRTCYLAGIAGLGLCFALFPVLGALAEWDGGRVGPWVWGGIAVQLGAYMLSYMSYACMFMYIASSAPSRSSLGTVNGIAQLTASSSRALAPSIASSLFAFSLELGSRGSAGGRYLVYVVLCAVSAAAVAWGLRLPAALGGGDGGDGKSEGEERGDSEVVQ